VAEVSGVRISHADRVMYPRLGLTKEDVAKYYEAIAPHMVPDVRDRPLTLVRCPDGAEAPCAFMRHLRVWGRAPLRRVDIREKTKTGDYLLADSGEALVALAQMDVLEVHTWNARSERLEQPDRLVFDLDPGPGVAWSRVVEAAQTTRGLLDGFGLSSFAKTTGGKGLHVVVPLSPSAGWGECLEFCRAVAQSMERARPRAFTASMVKSARHGRIYVDYLRNHRAASSIASYSTRARPEATVSIPIAWDELTPELDPLAFTVKTVPSRLATLGRDPWAGYEDTGQRLRRSMLRAIRR
jgi:bifunctional non-homologous end joining protein LigD